MEGEGAVSVSLCLQMTALTSGRRTLLGEHFPQTATPQDRHRWRHSRKLKEAPQSAHDLRMHAVLSTHNRFGHIQSDRGLKNLSQYDPDSDAIMHLGHACVPVTVSLLCSIFNAQSSWHKAEHFCLAMTKFYL